MCKYLIFLLLMLGAGSRCSAGVQLSVLWEDDAAIAGHSESVPVDDEQPILDNSGVDFGSGLVAVESVVTPVGTTQEFSIVEPSSLIRRFYGNWNWPGYQGFVEQLLKIPIA